MSSIILSHQLSDMGWRWRVVRASRVAHLVPARLGPLSRSACKRYGVTDEEDLEQPVGLLAEIPRCDECARADG